MANQNRQGAIIKQLCAEILLPIGVFQKGASRVYLDDNGCFFTVIEFQPSSRSKGTFLNIALHFLWAERPYITYDFYTGPSSRVKGFVAYESDAQFERAVRPYAELARNQVIFYRRFREPGFAKNYIKSQGGAPMAHTLENIDRLEDDAVLNSIRRTRIFWRSKPMMKRMPHSAIFDE